MARWYSNAPDHLAGEGAPGFGSNPKQVIKLRPSYFIRLIVFLKIFLITAAVHASVAPREGLSVALQLAAMVWVILVWGLIAYERQCPAILEINADVVRATHCNGRVLFQGSVVRCGRWGQGLLVFAVVVPQRRRLRSFLVAADALSPESFRQLAVWGRYVLC